MARVVQVLTQLAEAGTVKKGLHSVMCSGCSHVVEGKAQGLVLPEAERRAATDVATSTALSDDTGSNTLSSDLRFFYRQFSVEGHAQATSRGPGVHGRRDEADTLVHEDPEATSQPARAGEARHLGDQDGVTRPEGGEELL